MEAHDLEKVSVVEGAYDCDSESEAFLEDSVDEDELSYGSFDILKLQFRKEASRALWIDALGMAEVVENKGKMWTTTGIVRSGKMYCSIEETLFLIEIGALDVLNDNGAPLSISDMYRKLADDRSRHGCSWESFEVYRHLKYLGYIVGRHGIPWSSKNFKHDATLEEGSGEFDSTRENGSISSCFIKEKISALQLSETKPMLTEKISALQLSETKPMYDVYPPNSKFKKSSPGSPCFVLHLISGRPPSKQEIENLEIRCGENPLKFCFVEHGRLTPINLGGNFGEWLSSFQVNIATQQVHFEMFVQLLKHSEALSYLGMDGGHIKSWWKQIPLLTCNRFIHVRRSGECSSPDPRYKESLL